MPYPSANPGAKHDVQCRRFPTPNVSLQDADGLCFSTTPDLFKELKKKELPELKPLAFVYSFQSDAPNPPLSRSLNIIGVVPNTLSVLRKLGLGEEELDEDDNNDEIPECLTQSVIAVRRGDGSHMQQLERKHVSNSKAFGQFVQRLRNDQVVAVLGPDKYGRFGFLKPIAPPDNAHEKYREQDFYCRCYVGKVTEVRQFLTQGISNGGTKKQNNNNHANDEPTYKPRSPSPPPPPGGDEDGPIWKPPDEDDGGGGDNGGGGGGDLWQPPGADAGGGGGGGDFSWQPPGADSSGGGGGFESSAPAPWESAGSDSAPAPWENADNTAASNDFSSSAAAASSNKRGREEDDDEDDNGEGGDSQFHSNKGAAAADAFYSGLTRSLDTRADSRLYHMRAFNGWVKATQISELDPHTGTRGPIRVLDLACGKGGDLGKWVMHPRGLADYVGSDVARGSLKDAAIRARQMRNRLKRGCTFTCADLGHDVPGRFRHPSQKQMQKLLTWSLQKEPTHGAPAEPEFKMERGGGIGPEQRFDVVSIQFAIHYMMQTRQRARRFFHTVSQLLEVGGNLICTTIDATVVIGHLMNLGANLHCDDAEPQPAEIRVGAGACRIKFEPEIVQKIVQGYKSIDDLFGLEYTFTLVEGSDHGAGVGDAVNLPEWLTPVSVLTSLAEEVGLELEYAQNFHQFFEKRQDQASALNSLYSMKVLNRNGAISPDEWQISRLYCAVRFRKARQVDLVLEDEPGNEMPEDEDDDDEEELDETLKMQLMPMAMMKAKRAAAGNWDMLSAEEKTKLTEVELQTLAKAQKQKS